MFEAGYRRRRRPQGCRGHQAELWGDQQWQVFRSLIEERNPKVIGIDRSTKFAFADGLSTGEFEGISAALGDEWTTRFRNAEGCRWNYRLALSGGRTVLQADARLVWSMIGEMFCRAITPGNTRTSDPVWWWRQRVNDWGSTPGSSRGSPYSAGRER